MGSSVRSTLVSSVSALATSSTLAPRPSQSIKSQSATGTALSEPLLLEKARTPLLPASTPSGFELSVIRSFAQSSFFIFIFRSSSFASDLISNLFLTIDRLVCFSGDCVKQRLMQHEFASSANGNRALVCTGLFPDRQSLSSSYFSSDGNLSYPSTMPSEYSFHFSLLLVASGSASIFLSQISIGNQPARFASTFPLMI